MLSSNNLHDILFLLNLTVYIFFTAEFSSGQISTYLLCLFYIHLVFLQKLIYWQLTTVGILAYGSNLLKVFFLQGTGAFEVEVEGVEETGIEVDGEE